VRSEIVRLEVSLKCEEINPFVDPELISETGERERTPSRYFNRLKEVAVLKATGSRKFHI